MLLRLKKNSLTHNQGGIDETNRLTPQESSRFIDHMLRIFAVHCELCSAPLTGGKFRVQFTKKRLWVCGDCKNKVTRNRNRPAGSDSVYKRKSS